MLMTSNYSLVLTFDNERERLVFPLLPQEITVSSQTKNQTVDVMELGEVTLFGDKALDELAWESKFPFDSGAWNYIDKLRRWKNTKKPVHLIATGFGVNGFFAITEFEYKEIGGDVGSIYYSIRLKEYRDVEVKVINMIGDRLYADSAPRRVDSRVAKKIYKVKQGDYLYLIAKMELGNAEKWRDIAKLNNILAPYTIYPGQILTLPEVR